MRCEEIMKRDVTFVKQDDNVRDAARKMRDENIGFLPVCDQSQRVVGTMTDRDIAIRVCAEDRSAGATRVDDVMTRDVVSCRPGDDVERCLELMRTHHKSRMLITDEDEKLVGVISLSDIAERIEAEKSGETLREVAEREVHP